MKLCDLHQLACSNSWGIKGRSHLNLPKETHHFLSPFFSEASDICAGSFVCLQFFSCDPGWRRPLTTCQFPVCMVQQPWLSGSVGSCGLTLPNTMPGQCRYRNGDILGMCLCMHLCEPGMPLRPQGNARIPLHMHYMLYIYMYKYINIYINIYVPLYGRVYI